MEITKEQLIFSRGEGGSLIPQEVELESIEGKPTVKLVPLTRGKLQEIYAQATSDDAVEKVKADSEIVKCGLISPKLSEEDIADLKPSMAVAITQAVLAISLGTTQAEISDKTQEVLLNQEEALKKK